MSKTHFSVQMFDAFDSPPYSGLPLNVGNFATAALALACAKKIIDDQLNASVQSGLNEVEAISSFEAAGEIPMILGESTLYLQPFEYAQRRISALAAALNNNGDIQLIE